MLTLLGEIRQKRRKVIAVGLVCSTLLRLSELLGGSIEACGSENAIAEELARINEQLAIKNRRSKKIWQIILGFIVAIAVLTVALVIIFSVDPNSVTTDVTEVTKPIIP